MENSKVVSNGYECGSSQSASDLLLNHTDTDYVSASHLFSIVSYLHLNVSER